MKRRVVSIVTALALCLGLCPTWALAADMEPDAGLCPHHRVHTEDCGYVPPSAGEDCTHEHDENCFTAETVCVHQHTADCYPEPDPDAAPDAGPEPSLCTHECSEESGCVTLTLDCPHVHDEFCGFVPEDAGAPCGFVCWVCPVEELIDELPRRVTPDNQEQVEDQLNEILALYTELTEEEQDQLDLSRCFDLQAQLDEANTPMMLDEVTIKLTMSQSNKTSINVAASDQLTYEIGANTTITATNTPAMIVQDGGELILMGSGKVTSQSGSGVKVETGGTLTIDAPNLTVDGTSYGLEVESGAMVKLSGGTYTGGTAAIWADDYDGLLEIGYAYFVPETDTIIPAEDMSTAAKVAIEVQPVIEWGKNVSVPVGVNYDGSEVAKSELPSVTVSAPKKFDNLIKNLKYVYKISGADDSTYTEVDGLPTNAGTYEVMVKLPGTDDYHSASSEPIRLTINKINPINEAIEIGTLTYEGKPLDLVTAGSILEGATLEGASLEFKLGEYGVYSEAIPTGKDAGEYSVWYRVRETDNYFGVEKGPLTVKIAPKELNNPTIILSETSYQYTGVKFNPKITVMDGDTQISESQYMVTWTSDDLTADESSVLRDVGTYTATITNVDGGNYKFTVTDTVTVEIVPASQYALSIIGKPEHVYYGDEITTLSTVGGTGNGSVKWKSSDEANAPINSASGVLDIKDVGTFTITAEREVENYGTVSDTWTFTVEPKPVVAKVTIASKEYDGKKNISAGDIKVIIDSSDYVVSTDSITITGLTGTYNDTNAGTNKIVTLDGTSVNIGGDFRKYNVSFPEIVTAEITPRNIAANDVTVTLSGNDLQEDTNGTYYYVFDGTEKTPDVTVVVTDKANTKVTIPSSDYTVSYSNNKNVSTAAKQAQVTVTRTGGNYTFNAQTVDFEIRSDKAILLSSPQARNLTYNGDAQDLVTVGTASGGTVVYSTSGAEDTYGPSIPQEIDAGTYKVYYKVEGDSNHKVDAAASYVYATIKPKEITPTIELGQTTYTYDGTAHEPGVTVKDGTTVIGADSTKEYDVSYRDNINAGTATVIVSNANGGNYIVNGTANFTIEKADPTPNVKSPTSNGPLKYNGTAQELITRGGSPDGKMVYSLDDVNYSEAVPTGTAVGPYTVHYKVLGDANHKDTTPATLPVQIEQNTVTNPTITLSSDTFRYNGSQQKPTIVVRDDKGQLIQENEYVVKYTGKKSDNPVNVDDYTLTVTAAENSNYDFQTNNTRDFKIVPADQETISITGTRDQVYYGDSIQLGTTGGTGDGSVTWVVTGANNITQSGLLTVKDVGGPIKVTATRTASGNYNDVSATWEFSASEKPVRAVLTGVDRDYIVNDTSVTVKAIVDPSDLVAGDSIVIPTLTGHFDDANVGTNKRITIDNPSPVSNGKYLITYPATATASIFAANAEVGVAPTGQSLTYDASKAQELVTAGSVDSTTGGFMVYSLDGVNYSQTIPKEKDVGTYTVYYKVKGDNNHNDSQVGTETVTISQQTVANPQIELSPSKVQYDGSVKRPEVIVRDGDNHVIPSSEYMVTYDPNQNWIDKGSYNVTIKDISGGNYKINETTVQFDITETEQNPLKIVNLPAVVHYGDTFQLSTEGGSGDGAVTWESTDVNIAKVDPDTGLVEILDTGAVTITAKKATSANYSESVATFPFYALPRPITAIVTADNKLYDTTTDAKIHVAWKDGDLVGADTIDTESTLKGTFETPSVGTNITVNITGKPLDDATSQKYDITIPETTTASIFKAEEPAPSVMANSSLVLYNGSEQALVTGGGPDTLYSETRDGVYTTDVPKGKNAGTYDIWYKAPGSDNYNESVPKALRVTISPKTLYAAAITLSSSSFVYDGTEKRPTVTVSEGNQIIPSDQYTVTYSNNTAAGNATVTVTGIDGGNYTIDHSETFVIAKGQAKFVTEPQARVLDYTGAAQQLVTPGTTLGDIGVIEYRLGDSGDYSTEIPTAKDAGNYTVWYKIADSDNYASITPARVPVTINKAATSVTTAPTVSGSITTGQKLNKITLENGEARSEATNEVVPGSFTWVNGEDIESTAGSFDRKVTFTPDDTTNYNSVTIQITVRVDSTPDTTEATTEATTDSDINNDPVIPPAANNTPAATEPSEASAPMRTSVQDGSAVMVVDAAAGGELVKEAAANQSANVVIKPEVTDDVTRMEVSIPASTVSQLNSETNASLTVSTPIADVTIPNEALETLSSAGGTISVVTEQVENGVVVKLTADGADIGGIPGGLTLTVPVEETTPGTVAVLVHEDGTRETIRKSVAGNGEVNVPLNGSATIEIVDNSKEFADVSATAWEAGAVAFASAHELFNGTSETTFSPEQPMSRAMLATVLYNLEGRPAQTTASTFSDVGSDEWYADSVSWAAENGIVNGDGGQFRPDDNVTREQFAVMLWRYAGSPAADGQDLNFTDADKASGYAQEALRWAAANGILNGYGNGQLDPGGLATRAQAAQMLKNFMENT